MRTDSADRRVTPAWSVAHVLSATPGWKSAIAHSLLLLLTTLFSFTLIGCEQIEASIDKWKDEEKEVEKDPNEDLVPVEVATLASGPIESVLRFSTNLEAESEVQVFSQSSRLVTKLLVEEGSKVKAGQVLLRLQDDAQKSALARIQSQLEKAERELVRQKNLFAKELIPEQTFNDKVYEVDQLELQLADARRELSYTEVTAPFSGTVTQRMVNLGDHITVNQHLFDLVDFDTIVARIFVPEKDLSRLHVGQGARLRSESLDGMREGKVLRIAPVVDPKSGTVKVTVGIPGNQGMLPGQYVEVELVVERKEEALLVPKRALIYDDTSIFVYRLKDDLTVERLMVEAEVEDQRYIEPRFNEGGRGLQPGDRVVVAGQAGLKDGNKVRLADTDRDLPAAPSDLTDSNEPGHDLESDAEQTAADEDPAEETVAEAAT